MKTKEEVIKEAWGDLYNHGVGIDGNGWLSENYLTNKQCVEFNSNSDLEYDTELGYRPKSLQGIENNNGWIRIESEADLPKEDTSVHIVFTNYKGKVGEYMTFGDWINKDKCFYSGGMRIYTATHYQPIVKPNKPLY